MTYDQQYLNIAKHECIELYEAESIDETERGSGGFGSTGHTGESSVDESV